VGSILEAAKLQGFKTGLVVTSTINHATPACEFTLFLLRGFDSHTVGYAAHVANRNSYETIAEHEIGYSHPFGPVVDILMGGGRCYFKPQSDPTSCRSDDKDLFGFAKKKGFRVMQDRAGFDEMKKGTNKAADLPYIGLFNDDQMMYEIDRSRQPDKEPSLLEMVETALNSLDRATKWSMKGYFLMIEASRIDHAGHANDPAAHLHDTIMYNNVMKFVREWIDKHPDTMMMSAADHECGGLTLNGFNPIPLKDVSMSIEQVNKLWGAYNGTDRRGYLANTILPGYGLSGLSESDIDTILKNNNLGGDLTKRLSSKAGVNWSTGGHTASDITLFGYGSGWRGGNLRADMAGNWDNTQLPGYIEGVLKVKMADATKKLRAKGTSWVGKRDMSSHKHDHIHSH
jgi:alkaline phosphatase